MTRKIPVPVGQIFGRLTVIGEEGRYAICRCVCGNVTKVKSHPLRSGNTTSCGCYNRSQLKLGNVRRTHGMRSHPLYSVWKEMRRRCTSQQRDDFKNYGGRGISVCERWNDFALFVADMGERPPAMTIERIDNNLGYDKANCRWASRADQNRNRRFNRIIDVGGMRMILAQAARLTGIGEATIRKRLKLGWSVERAVSTGVRR